MGITGWMTYAACTLLYVLALMSKPTSTPLPLVLLLLDFWPLGRMVPADPSAGASWRGYLPSFSRLSWEKVPLLLLSAASCVVTYLAQAGGER
jgi:hypothetical protein